jgi:hypothetical protein
MDDRLPALRAALPPARWQRWPLPALAVWLAAWALLWLLRSAGVPAVLAVSLVSVAGAAAALGVDGGVRRVIVAAGFPLSALALGAVAEVPPWAWAVAALPLLLIYPMKAWRDAPFFPTPASALDGLGHVIALAPGARILDAGCGAGHGLQALHRQWPQARLEGVEWSAPLRLLARWRCPWANVQRADMWGRSWAGFDVVYLFQRPESMARAAAKAGQEMRPGSWLVSLEFAAETWVPTARCGAVGGRPVWVYRIGGAEPTKPASTGRARRR